MFFFVGIFCLIPAFGLKYAMDITKEGELGVDCDISGVPCGCSALVCITSYYDGNETRMQQLVSSVRAVHGWGMRLSIKIFTQDAVGLEGALKPFAIPTGPFLDKCNGNISIHEPEDMWLINAYHKNNYLLAFAHRPVMEQEQHSHDYFAYVEHDMEIPWEAVLAWGNDQRKLEAEGLAVNRGFFRWEYKTSFSPIVIDFDACDFDYQHHPCKFVTSDGSQFVGLRNSYDAVFLMSRHRLHRLMKEIKWFPPFAKPVNFEGEMPDMVDGCPLNIRECAASPDTFLHSSDLQRVPETRGCQQRDVVPVEMLNGRPSLAKIAGLHHLGQNYHPFMPSSWTFDGCLNTMGSTESL